MIHTVWFVARSFEQIRNGKHAIVPKAHQEEDMEPIPNETDSARI